MAARFAPWPPSQDEREEEMRRDEPTCEEPDRGDEGRQLAGRKPGDGVARSASAGVGGSEADQEAAETEDEETLHREEPRPREQIAGNEPVEVPDSQRNQIGPGLGRDRDRLRVGEQGPADEPAEEDAEDEGQVPRPRTPPIEPEE